MEPIIGRVSLSPSENTALGTHIPWEHEGRHFLDEFVGFDMEVHYNNQTGSTDRGVLRRFGDRWIEIVRHAGKPKQDSLLIPFEAIRMIRPIGPPRTLEHTLLRPVDLPEPEGEEGQS